MTEEVVASNLGAIITIAGVCLAGIGGAILVAGRILWTALMRQIDLRTLAMDAEITSLKALVCRHGGGANRPCDGLVLQIETVPIGHASHESKRHPQTTGTGGTKTFLHGGGEIAGACIFLVVSLFVLGCSSRPLLSGVGASIGTDPLISPIDQLGHIGAMFTCTGAIVAGLGLVVRIVAMFGFLAGPVGAILSVIAPFLSIASWLGIAAIIVGVSFHLVAVHPWIALCAVVAALLARYLTLHPRLGGRFLAWLETKAKKITAKRVMRP